MNGKNSLGADDDLFADIVIIRANKNANGEFQYSLELGFMDSDLKQRQQQIISIPKSLSLHIRAKTETGGTDDKWFKLSIRKARKSNELRYSFEEKQS